MQIYIFRHNIAHISKKKLSETKKNEKFPSYGSSEISQMHCQSAFISVKSSRLSMITV